MLIQNARRGLQPLASTVRGFSCSSLVQAAPAISTVPSEGGFLAKLFGASPGLQLPLTDPLPGVDFPPSAAVKPELKITTLANGSVVASENAPVSRMISPPRYVNSHIRHSYM